MLITPRLGAHSAEIIFATNDSALIVHIKKSDSVFTRALKHCSSEKIERNVTGDKGSYEYAGYCSATAADDSDCSGNEIVAVGPIDLGNLAQHRT